MNYRRLFCFVLAVCMTVLMAGCGEDLPVTEDLGTPVTAAPDTAVTIGQHKLTAIAFNYYYRDAVDEFYNDWANSYIYGEDVADFDPTLPLNEQYYDAEKDITWADHLVQEALAVAKEDYVLWDLANTEGFRLNEEQQAALDYQRTVLSENALLYGYGDTDSFLSAYYGPEFNERNFMAYVERQMIAEAYANAHRESLHYSEDILTAHDTGSYEPYPMGNVRHLLVTFESTAQDETGSTVYTDEDKANTKKQAEEYLALWKSGAADELSFSQLVKEYSDDGYAETGGLYENIHPESNYVDNFKNWATDPARKAGDTDIIETEYGYHVMYFTGWSELNYRDYMITEALRDADQKAWLQEILKDVETEVLDYSDLELDRILDTGITG